MFNDHLLLQAALEGLELRRSRIDEQISQIKQALSGKSLPAKRTRVPEASDAPVTAKKASKKRMLSPEARERIAAAQKARWARARGEA